MDNTMSRLREQIYLSLYLMLKSQEQERTSLLADSMISLQTLLGVQQQHPTKSRVELLVTLEEAQASGTTFVMLAWDLYPITKQEMWPMISTISSSKTF
jgi:hypothetical protein